MQQSEAITKDVFGPKFYMPTIVKDKRRIEELHFTSTPRNYPSRLYQPECANHRTITAHDLREMWTESQIEEGIKVMLMWNPFGPIWVADGEMAEVVARDSCLYVPGTVVDGKAVVRSDDLEAVQYYIDLEVRAEELMKEEVDES